LLDVVEQTGKLRFSVTLGAPSVGSLVIDAKGTAFAATRTGNVVGIDSNGQRVLSYRSPVGVRFGLTFNDELGLLVVGQNNVVFGVNRRGYPVFYYPIRDDVSFGIVSLDGFCVVATASGNLVWLSQGRRRYTYALGGSVAGIERTASDGLWVLVETVVETDVKTNGVVRSDESNRNGLGKTLSKLSVFDRQRTKVFEVPDVLRFATVPFRRAGTFQAAGAVLRGHGTLQWLGEQGQNLAEIELSQLTQTSIESSQIDAMTLDDEGTIWLVVERDTLIAVSPTGQIGKAKFTGSLLAPVVDQTYQRIIVATDDGAVFSVTRLSTGRSLSLSVK
jgi:ligand-binding sensor domain-containing protein